ncbi:hypothetical protein Bca52824_046690 [Brassica carinata]|uniref:Uncharacterized protein n=1 Tax=Brassica carinata TaxID=52824 RepID=A0A8X7URD6_BRACI|nr:hypothetical protein Bca52824_046690 [Brassica carinata]
MICFVKGYRGISDNITILGLVNVDFADVRAIMANAGSSLMGVGTATGKYYPNSNRLQTPRRRRKEATSGDASGCINGSNKTFFFIIH